MSIEIHSQGWACTDCANLIANAEAPCDLPEDMLTEYLARFDRGVEGFDVCLGGDHAEFCDTRDSNECECEYQEFSWGQCYVCRSNLGGRRYAVTYFERYARMSVS